MKTFIELVKENIRCRRQMWELAKVHQKKQFRGSDMGLMWAFAKPSMYIIVFYVAIVIGFKSSTDIDGLICPYFVWLAIGMISFFYMRDMILNGANCFKKYGAIVAKAKEAGLVMTNAGATFPYGKDPKDSNIRIAPSYPTLEELKVAADNFVLSVKLVRIDKLLGNL